MNFPAQQDLSFDSSPDGPPEGERWSTWDVAQHGQGAGLPDPQVAPAEDTNV